MRREPIPKEYPVHIVRRGARGLPFACDDLERWRNLQILFYFNDTSSRLNWFRDLEEKRKKSKQENAHFFSWPVSWPERKPLLSIWAFSFNYNHDHIIAKEIEDGGVSKFMQNSNASIAKHFNEKYNEKGSVLQPYAIRVIDSDEYLKWVVPYVVVKNTFEMHPKGYKWAVENYEKAWEWAINFPFSSLADLVGVRSSPIVDVSRLKEILGTPEEIKELCKDMIVAREEIDEEKMDNILYFSHEKAC